MSRLLNNGRRNATTRLVLAVGVLCTCVVFLAQCAVFNPNNRRLTGALDKKIQPETTTAKIALAPIVIPLGFAALSADFAIVHPISTLPKCWEDTARIIWRNPSGGLAQQTFLFVPKVILSPILFVADFLLRSLFDVD